MNAIVMTVVSPFSPLPMDLAGPDQRRDLGFATVCIGSRGTAQGPVTHRFRDGRVTVDAGGTPVTGHPVGGTAQCGWWARIGSMPIL